VGPSDQVASLPAAEPTPAADSAWQNAEPLIRACVGTLQDESLSGAQQRAYRQTTQRLLGRVAVRCLEPSEAVRFVFDADDEISRRLDRLDAHV
jgi:hypothetical protein